MRILKIAAIFIAIGMTANAQETAVDQFPVGGVNTTSEPQEVVRGVYGDWEIRCTTANNTCFLYQLMLNNEGTPVAELSLVKLPVGSEAVAGATVVAPLGTLLTRGVLYRVDEGEPTQYPFSWCTAPGCFSRFGLTDLTVNSMKSGSEIKMTLFSIANTQVPVEVSASLNGFTAAFEALENQAQ